MNNIDYDFLPIGSVCTLKDNKKVMVTGFLMTDPDKNKVFDYCGCFYPIGYISSDENYLFDRDKILKIDFIGYTNDVEKKFKADLKKYLKLNANVDNKDNNTIGMINEENDNFVVEDVK